MTMSMAAERESIAYMNFHVHLWKLLPWPGCFIGKPWKYYVFSCIFQKESKKDVVKWQMTEPMEDRE